MGTLSSHIIKCRKVLKEMYHDFVVVEKVEKCLHFYTSITITKVTKFCEALLKFQFQTWNRVKFSINVRERLGTKQ